MYCVEAPILPVGVGVRNLGGVCCGAARGVSGGWDVKVAVELLSSVHNFFDNSDIFLSDFLFSPPN